MVFGITTRNGKAMSEAKAREYDEREAQRAKEAEVTREKREESPAPIIKVETIGGKPAVTSLQVAAAFGKDHFNVLRDIEQIISQVPENFSKLNFEFTERETRQTFGTRKDKMYLLTRDGFTLLVMGYTGEKAMRIKVAYIAEFNRMEEELRKQKEGEAKALPQDYVSALKALVVSEEEKIKIAEKAQFMETLARQFHRDKLDLTTELETQKPRIEFATAVEGTINSVSIKQMAAILTQNGISMGQNNLYEFLRANNVLCRTEGKLWNLPYQRFLDNGWFEIRENIVQTKYGPITKCTPLVTGAGQVGLLNLVKRIFKKKYNKNA